MTTGFKQNFGQASGAFSPGYIYKMENMSGSSGDGYVLFDNGLVFLYGIKDTTSGSTHTVTLTSDLTDADSEHRLQWVTGIILGPINSDGGNATTGYIGSNESQHLHLHSSFDASEEYPTEFKFYTRQGTGAGGAGSSDPAPIGRISWFAMGFHHVQSTD